MGTIIINGKRFDGNNVRVCNGKVVIDGTPQPGELHGAVELQVFERALGRAAKCIASVTCGEAGRDFAADASVACNPVGGLQAQGEITAGERVGGGISVVAIASAANGPSKKKT